MQWRGWRRRGRNEGAREGRRWKALLAFIICGKHPATDGQAGGEGGRRGEAELGSVGRVREGGRARF